MKMRVKVKLTTTASRQVRNAERRSRPRCGMPYRVSLLMPYVPRLVFPQVPSVCRACVGSRWSWRKHRRKCVLSSTSDAKMQLLGVIS